MLTAKMSLGSPVGLSVLFGWSLRGGGAGAGLGRI